MTKHQLYGYWNRIKDSSLVILIAIVLVSGLVSVFALRANNQHMLELKNAVYAADQNDGDIETALLELRHHVYSHMNTSLRSGANSNEPPIQLVNKFNRIVAAEQARVASLNNSAKVYAEAQARCEKASVPLTTRAQCIQDYVSVNGSGVQQLNLPPKEFYTFDFASPVWTPDIAGISLLVFFVALALLVIRILAGFILKPYLRK